MMKNNTNGLNYYFDPDASSTNGDLKDGQEWEETQTWSQVERSKRGAPRKLVASA